MSTKMRNGMTHLWRGVRAGIVVLAASPAVQAVVHGGKPEWFGITSAMVAAAVTAESVFSAATAPPAPQPPPAVPSGPVVPPPGA